MKTIEGKVLVLSMEELRNTVVDWHVGFLMSDEEIMREFVRDGNPDFADVMRQGIANMDMQDLIDNAGVWADMTADGEGLSGIIVEDENGNQEIIVKFEEVGPIGEREED